MPTPRSPSSWWNLPELSRETVQGMNREPVGHTIDLLKPDHMSPKEYTQHVYMILGRTTEWTLLKHFPRDEGGGIDMDGFETGPPEYIIKNLEESQRRADLTRSRMPELLQRSKCFLAHANIPTCHLGDIGRAFIHNEQHWDPARMGEVQARTSCSHHLRLQAHLGLQPPWQLRWTACRLRLAVARIVSTSPSRCQVQRPPLSSNPRDSARHLIPLQNCLCKARHRLQTPVLEEEQDVEETACPAHQDFVHGLASLSACTSKLWNPEAEATFCS